MLHEPIEVEDGTIAIPDLNITINGDPSSATPR
jgi:hypothetical protein